MDNFSFKKLEGSLVELSLFQESDITEEYISWLNDPVVVQYSNQRHIKHDMASCQKYLSSFKNTNNLFILIKTKKEKKSIGTMNAYLHQHGVVDFGILIGDTSKWGKGYGQDAWNTIIVWALQIEGMRKITAGTLSCNYGMLKLIEKSGMTLERVKKNQEVIKEKEVEAHFFCKFKNK